MEQLLVAIRDAATEYAIQSRQTVIIIRAAEGKPLAFPKQLDASEAGIVPTRRGFIGLEPVPGTRTDSVMRIELAAYERLRKESHHDAKAFHYFAEHFKRMIDMRLEQREEKGAEFLVALGQAAETRHSSSMSESETLFMRDLHGDDGVDPRFAPFIHNMVGIHAPMYEKALDIVHSAYAKLDFLSDELLAAMPTNGVEL